ncbi:TIGR01777 family protein [Mycolicibacterium duvalii]|uniref:Nucleoside-diphosphate sugar epimerase n=1 Tax=Mycolicibacterium duvalii TaxID=39688 RepID=A0A7I7JW52_9MYCO|nr:TIGR01777 family oxidoreductase [Mycolicibacterium duvalii]MCV7369342.1 TIGR01777 family protein [Mycolicibacterium duvalii]PEG40597.1 TIGR01777 family protein [Mycolicibacterium duvalii]BBX16060.1 nucleoside-diphosphate sugar epimerase [Mycolicibacterium duvalii]
MGIDFESIVDQPRDEVWTWHTRPGAIHRLTPPWQPMRALAEAESLADGTAVLRLPGGLRWVARHDPSAYQPPYRFVDELSSDGVLSWPVRLAGGWRHTHTFEDIDGTRTRMRDRVESAVPAGLLRPMFVYRHRQVADDLAAHRRAADAGLATPTVVAVTGASGLVGAALSAFLTTGGHRVIRLVRRPARGADERQWTPTSPAGDLLDGVDAVIHLAGESIAGRFNSAHRAKIRDSRVEPTRRLAEVAAGANDGPRVFISASAIGFYGSDRGDTQLTEDSGRGDGFLADVVTDWEAATTPAHDAGLRVVKVRTGIVQSAAGGTLHLLRPLFAAGLGGRVGDGRQWMAWIGLDDLIDIYHRALFDERLEGAVNAVAPEPVRNSEYTATLARVLHRPALVPVPPVGPRILLGEQGARELAEASQRVVPATLLGLEHTFRAPDLGAALAHQLGRAEPAT